MLEGNASLRLAVQRRLDSWDIFDGREVDPDYGNVSDTEEPDDMAVVEGSQGMEVSFVLAIKLKLL